jgi:hypothetical protein
LSSGVTSPLVFTLALQVPLAMQEMINLLVTFLARPGLVFKLDTKYDAKPSSPLLIQGTLINNALIGLLPNPLLCKDFFLNGSCALQKR